MEYYRPVCSTPHVIEKLCVCIQPVEFDPTVAVTDFVNILSASTTNTGLTFALLHHKTSIPGHCLHKNDCVLSLLQHAK